MEHLFMFWFASTGLLILIQDVVVCQQVGYNVAQGEGISSLDATFLREIAVALDPSLQSASPTQNHASLLRPQSSNSLIQNSGTGTKVADTAPSCSGKGGFFADYAQNCRIYYRCNPSGRMARFECPMNFIFSEQAKRCDSPERVVCAPKTSENGNVRTILPASGFPNLAGAGNSWERPIVEETAPPLLSAYEPIIGLVGEQPELLQAANIKIMGEPRTVPLDIDPDICVGRQSLYVADADTGCKGYIQCGAKMGAPFISYMCPELMRFDTKTSQCLPRSHVRCVEAEFLFPRTLGPTLTTQPGQNPGFNIVTRTNAVTDSPLSFNNPSTSKTVASPCMGKIGVFVPDYSLKCRVYYYCNNDNTFINLTCPSEMIFNSALQSCDFFQSAPECRSPIPSPQKMAEPLQPKSAESRQQTSPWSNGPPRFRSLIPQNVINRPSPGLPTLEMPTGYQKPASLPRPSPLKSSVMNYSPLTKSAPQTNALHPNPTLLEGFNGFDAVGIADGFMNRININGVFGKPAQAPSSPSAYPTVKKLGTTNPGSAITVYETECNQELGTVAYHIEPESGCRIWHLCHPNLTMETFSCSRNHVFVHETKACVSNQLAFCMDPISSDAKDILTRHWEATTPTPTLVDNNNIPLTASSTAASAPLKETSTSSPNSVNAPVEAQCLPGMTGLYGIVSAKCTKYYECHIDGSMFTHNCPQALKFNSHLKACDWAEYVDSNCNEFKTGPLRV